MDVRKTRVHLNTAIALGLSFVAGCVSTPKKDQDQPPTGPVCRVESYWHSGIVTTADVVHKGTTLPGLAGRVYFLGQDMGTPLKGKGKLLVDMYDDVHVSPEGQPRLLEHYEYPDEVLARLIRKDMIGWGYTVFLPWPEYRPDIKHVQLKVSFTPDAGTPMFAPPIQLTVRNSNNPLVSERVATVKAEELSPYNPSGAQIPMRIAPSESAGPKLEFTSGGGNNVSR
jgi:hypothetical protein